MKRHNHLLIVLGFFLLLSFPARAQYRLMIHDKVHNSYTEHDKSDQYTLVTSDSMIRTGYIRAFDKNAIWLTSIDSTYHIMLTQVMNFSISAGNNKASRVTARVFGYIIASLGGITGIGAIESISSNDHAAAVALGVLTAAGITGGVLLVRSSYPSGSSNREFLTKPRYTFRTVPSTF